MSFKVEKASSNAYRNSFNEFSHSLGHKAGRTFWDEYEVKHGLRVDDRYLIFENEEDAMMFLLRWV